MYCPHCQAYICNSRFLIDNPFTKCKKCKKYVVNRDKKEWISVSPVRRFFIKAFSFLNKEEIDDLIQLSLQRTQTAEYVDALVKANYPIYEIDGYQHSIYHDNSVYYCLHLFHTPFRDQESITYEQLPTSGDFTTKSLNKIIRYLDDPFLDLQDHQEKVYDAYSEFRFSVRKALFPTGIHSAEVIVDCFATLLDLDLASCTRLDYFYFLLIYAEFQRETAAKNPPDLSVENVKKKYPNIIKSDTLAHAILQVIVGEINKSALYRTD